MTDKIPSVDGSQSHDREGLNVGGSSQKNKSMIIGGFLLAGLFVIISAVSFAFVRFDEPELETVGPSASDTNYNEGSNKSSLNDSENFFASIGEEIKRKKETVLARLAKEKSVKDIKKPVVVERISNTPDRRQPDPKVSKRNNRRADRNAPLTPEERKMSGSVMVSFDNNNSNASPKPREFDNSFNASSFSAGSARLRKAGELDFMLIHGTSIPCALYTQIISDYDGFVTCRVTEDVYSANGAALLVERGSLVSGTQKVALELGKARVFTNWADIETPMGASIRIDSLGAGALGASGHKAWIDNHYAQRFGGAILLSFVDDALGALSNRVSNNDIQFDGSTENASEMASQALDASINIAPTGYSYIGQRINILVARDIDMSNVYRFADY